MKYPAVITGSSVGGFFFVLFFLFAVAPAEAEEIRGEGTETAVKDCTIVTIEGGISCINPDGSEELSLLHPTLFGEPRRYRNREGGIYPAGPLQRGDEVYYGVRQDLLRFSIERKEITNRWRLPSVIHEIRDGEDGELRLLVEAPGTEGDRLEIRFRPGETPLVAPWDWAQTLSPLHDVMWLEGVELRFEPRASDDHSPREEAEERALLLLLEQREEVDRTNPYLPLYRGEALGRLGEREASLAAFEEAARHEQADWLDALRIAMRLYYHGADELARISGARALEGLEEGSVTRENITSMVNASFGALWARDAIEAAREAENFQRLDEVATLWQSAMPALEGQGLAAQSLARVFGAANENELASKWEQLSAPGEVEALFLDAARQADLFVVLQFAALLVLLFSGAILGLGRLRDFEKEKGPKGKEWIKYLPRFSIIDTALLVGIIAALVAMPLFMVGKVQVMASFADAPAPLGGDGFSAPIAEAWLVSLDGGAAGRTLREHSQQSQEALKAGEAGPTLEATGLVIEALEFRVERADFRSFSEIQISRGAASDFGWIQSLQALELRGQGLILILIALVMNILILGGLLQIAASRFQGLDKWGQILVIGAPRSLSFLRIPVATAFVVGLMAVTPLGVLAQTQTTVLLAGYYGLGEVAISGVQGVLPGGLLLILSLVAHFVGVGLLFRKK